MWEQGKTEPVKQKEKISKNSYTQLSRNLDDNSYIIYIQIAINS